MKRIITFFPVMLAVALLVWVVGGCSLESSEPVAQLDWTTDLPQALAKAKTEHKLVLLDFTGSDWCPPCKALHKKVLATVSFKAYADTNLVLVEVDFPHDKPQSADLKKANLALAKQYNPREAFPTIVLLNADGKVLSNETGYGGARSAEFIAGLETAAKKN